MHSTYTIHTAETAPSGAKQPLEALDSAFGFIPNAAGVMAGSPALMNSFFSAFGHFRGGGTFTPAERQVLLLSNAVANNCAWAVAFHSLEALEDGVEPAAVDALRRRELPEDPRLAALSTLTRALVDHRGHLGETEVKAFTMAGFDKSQVLEVITGVAISTMTNHTANLTRPPLEPQIAAHVWAEGH